MSEKELSSTVFFNEVAINLLEKGAEENVNSVFIRSRSDMNRFLDRYFKMTSSEDVFLVGNNLDEMMNDFVSWFKFVETAGGIVTSGGEAYLLIRRFDLWDLPKGKLKKDEIPEDGAKREVTEETAVDGLKLVKPLPPTYHIYPHKERYVLKKTNWYLMETNYNGKLQAQVEEDITEVTWMNRTDAIKALNSSYRSIRDILIPCI